MPFVLTRQNLTPGMYHDSLAECKAVVISVKVKFTVSCREDQSEETDNAGAGYWPLIGC